MHQYRLLRDNKETGPYSASDLQAMGLKPYDLIWQEGKSAAWRYPGELDELKSFAPPVEEQPYDRFYKKPDSSKIPQTEFAPKPLRETESSTIIRKGHIVVTMPTALTRERSQQPAPKQEPLYQRQVLMTEEPVVTTMPVFQQAKANTPPLPPAPTSSSKLPVYLVAIASLVLIASLLVLIINNNIQNKKITQLRDIVTQMQQNQPAPGPDPISRQVVHYPLQQQAASVLNPIDSGVAVSSVVSSPKPQTPTKKKTTPPVPGTTTSQLPADSDFMKVGKIEKPVIEPTGDKRMAVKRDDINADNNLMQLVKVQTNDYKTGLLGGINNLKLTLFNKSLVALKKVEVQIDYLGPESRIVKSQTVYFENVGPGADLLLDVPKSNRGVKVNCIVKKIST